jgi:tetratricopeptide (TPR) repeat protein/tRNA A-37 threonylcarbamoyl transferase component Bud32
MSRDAELANRLFLREAQAVARIDHPNVVTLFEVLQEGEVSYLVMQYLEGVSLRQMLGERRLSVAEALKVACEVGAALGAAHQLGVIHRDLKPENVMVTSTGHCKVLDFGVAHLSDRSTLRDLHALVGTVPYMAPEQVRGETVDARTDVYSLGVLLFEMLTGRLPQEGQQSVVQLYEILNRPAPSLLSVRPDLPEDLARVVAQALSKKPEDRYPGIQELLHDLELIRARYSEPTLLPGERLYARPRRRRVALVAGAVLVAVAAAALAVRYIARPPSPAGPGGPRVMVTRWENRLSGEETRWLSNGIMDCLIRSLGGGEGLSVISRETVGATLAALAPADAIPSGADLVAAARKVGARYLVTGSAEPHGSGVRVVCDLTDLRKGVLMRSWSRDLAELSVDFYPAIDGIAAAIAAEMGASRRGRGGEAPSIARELPESIEALRFYQLGLEHEQAMNIPAAVDALHQAVAIDSNFTDAQLLLARLSRDPFEKDRALARAMASRDHASTTTRELVEAQSLLEQRRDTAAEHKYAAILARDRENVRAGSALGTLYLYHRRFQEAAAQYAALHEVTPYDFSFFSSWSVACLEIGRQDKAVALLEEWRRQFPREQGPLRWLIGTHQVLGDYAAALALCDTLDQLQPGAASAQRGFLLIELGRMREAERLFTGLLDSPDRFLPASRGRSYLAYLCLREREFARGLELVEPALRQDPGTYNYWLAGGLAVGGGQSARAGTFARAIERQFAATGADSTTPEAFGDRRFYYHLKGLIALAANQRRDAVRMFERALAHSSRNDETFFRTEYARGLLAWGDPARAARELESVLALNPHYTDALLELGKAYLRLGRRENARRVLGVLQGLWKDADVDFVLNQELKQLLRESAATRPPTG